MFKKFFEIDERLEPLERFEQIETLEPFKQSTQKSKVIRTFFCNQFCDLIKTSIERSSSIKGQ